MKTEARSHLQIAGHQGKIAVIRIISVLLLTAFPILSAGQTDARVVKPEIRVGDSWTYRATNVLGPGEDVHETRVSFADDKVILAVSTRKRDAKEFDSSWTPEWNAVTSYTGRMFRPHTGTFRFPLRVGDKHAVKYELLRPRLDTIESSTTGAVTVVGWETVDVPAGKFRALKVELDSMVQPSDGTRAYRASGNLLVRSRCQTLGETACRIPEAHSQRGAAGLQTQ